MRVNEALLEAHVSHRDDALGISEEFVRLQAGSGLAECGGGSPHG